MVFLVKQVPFLRDDYPPIVICLKVNIGFSPGYGALT